MTTEAHPSLPGVLGDGARLCDQKLTWPVATSRPIFDSAYLSLAIDTIVDPAGEQHPRVVARPNGAVGVLALDDKDRILLVEQYRHPVRQRMIELPAGTLDIDGEAPLAAAQRELAEEADIVAQDWSSLLSLKATPGYSTEGWQVYRAETLSAVPAAERTERMAEEADMVQWWIAFDAAVDAALDGRISDSMTVAAILAEQVRRTR